MNPASILMCVNIPRGVTEDLLSELFCVAGPIEDVSISKSGRSCFIIYEFEEAVKTAKEIFKDIKLYGRPFEMLDQNDIQSIHKEQEQESKHRQLESEYNTPKHYRFDSDGGYNRSNTFHNFDAMTPTRNDFANFRGGNHIRFSPQSPAGDYFVANPAYPGMNPLPPVNDRMNPYAELPPELDLFKSPYQKPVSRKNHEQSRQNFYHPGGDAPFINDRTPDFHRKRHSNEFSSPDYSNSNHSSPRTPNKRPHEFPSPISTDHSPNDSSHRKKHKNDSRNQISDDIYPINDVDVEHTYENRVRRQFHDSPRKPYRDDDHHRNSKYRNTPSTSSDYVVRNKSREFDRSPYSRRDHGSRRPNHYKEHRNRHKQ